MKEKVESSKVLNILDMSLTFSAMGRVFEKGSNNKIKKQLVETVYKIFKINSEKEYHQIHTEFCKWFVANILTAKRKKNGKITKKSGRPSWGQAAKIIDVSLKVCVYYCNLPSIKVSKKITPWLNGAIDTPILKYLLQKYRASNLTNISSIAQIDKPKYEEMQDLLVTDAESKSYKRIYRVQYDDILWRELNKKDS